jgi:hypothetical protein
VNKDEIKSLHLFLLNSKFESPFVSGFIDILGCQLIKDNEAEIFFIGHLFNVILSESEIKSTNFNFLTLLTADVEVHIYHTSLNRCGIANIENISNSSVTV